jgi:membrane protein
MRVREPFDLLKQTFQEWRRDSPTEKGAALAYYAVFSLAPLAAIAVAVAGWLFGGEAAQGELARQLEESIGPTFAQAITDMVGYAHQHGSSTRAAAMVSIVVLLLSAMGLFAQLRRSLNTIWGVRPKPGRGLRGVVRDRLLQFVMVIVVALLLLTSLITMTVVHSLGRQADVAGLAEGTRVWRILNWAISFLLIAVLFALIYKVLPDVKVSWRDVWIGSMLTTVLFLGGNFAIGMYLAQTGIASAYGAAGSIVIILLWVYYSSQVLLFGAEFTQVFANRYGQPTVSESAEPLHGKGLAAR